MVLSRQMIYHLRKAPLTHADHMLGCDYPLKSVCFLREGMVSWIPFPLTHPPAPSDTDSLLYQAPGRILSALSQLGLNRGRQGPFHTGPLGPHCSKNLAKSVERESPTLSIRSHILSPTLPADDVCSQWPALSNDPVQFYLTIIPLYS